MVADMFYYRCRRRMEHSNQGLCQFLGAEGGAIKLNIVCWSYTINLRPVKAIKNASISMKQTNKQNLIEAETL